MKQKFSKNWKKSKQRRKQRKYLANAPLHLRKKFLSSNLSKDLRKKYGRKSFPVKKGDLVKVMRGKFKGKTGKINNVEIKRTRVAIEKIQRQKKDGTKINAYFHPSKLQIQELNLDDREREVSLTKGEKISEKQEKDKGVKSKKLKKKNKKEK